MAEEAPAAVEAPELLLEEGEEDTEAKLAEDRKRERRLRRQLVYDEESDVLVAHRLRKREDDADEWQKY